MGIGRHGTRRTSLPVDVHQGPAAQEGYCRITHPHPARSPMKIVLAADGSNSTKKALAWLVTNPQLSNGDSEVVVVNVQPPVPARVKTIVGSDVVADYHQDEARKVLAPIQKFLDRHDLAHTTRWV